MQNLQQFKPREASKAKAIIAKNYLSPEELNALNRIVMAYLEFTEVRALNRQPMHMRDWLEKAG